MLKRSLVMGIMFGFFVLLLGFSNVLAKSDKSQNNEGEETVETKTENLKGTEMKLEKVKEELDDPEVENEIEDLQEDQEQADETIDNSLRKVEGRPSAVKFIMGPDYKNAGQVRSQIVRLQNNIRQMTRLKGKVGEGEQGSLDEAISTMNQELSSIEMRLYDALSGASLFGWLNRLLTGYIPLPSPTPVPSPTPTILPSPSVSPSPSPTV